MENVEKFDETGFNAELKAVILQTFSKIISTYNLQVIESNGPLEESEANYCFVHLFNEKAKYKLLINFNIYQGIVFKYFDLTQPERIQHPYRLDTCLHAIHQSDPSDTKPDFKELYIDIVPFGKINPHVRNMLTFNAYSLFHYGKNILEGDPNTYLKIAEINSEYMKERNEQENWEMRKAKQEKTNVNQ